MKPSTQSKQNMPVIAKAKGKYCWNKYGKKYKDFTGANLTTVLGYRQSKATVPNLPGVSITEQELTKLLSSYTGTKHMRYFKNGHNAVDCAVRLAIHLARNRDSDVEIHFMGYHGTGDAYMETTDNDNGTNFSNDFINSYQLKPGEKPSCGATDILVFESRYAEYADKIDAKIKICDTLKDGIRALYDGVDYGVAKTPPFITDKYYNRVRNNYDFTLYGKSIANGTSIAVMTGKDERMERIDEIYYSTTFGCNQDAMVECIRTIKDFEKVKDKYFDLYNYAKEVLPEWQSLTTDQIKAFQKEGILFNGYWSIHIKHTKKDIDFLSRLCNNILS